MYINSAGIINTSQYENDSILGTKLIPNKGLISFNEGFYVGNVNEFGYYGPSYPFIKDQDIYRIALIGDSYVEGHQLFERNHFRSILENSLSKKTNKKIEVLNFGRSGFNFNDEYCFYNNFVKKFDPDISLFFISQDDLKTIETNYYNGPYCYLEDDKIQINYEFINNKSYTIRGKLSWILRHSTIARLLIYDTKLLKKGLLYQTLFDKFYTFDYGNLFKAKQEIKIIPKKEENILILGKTYKMLMKNLSKENNCLIVANSLFSDTLIKQIESNKLSIIEPSEIYNKKYHYWKVTKKYGHWNYEAHNYLGQFLTDRLVLDGYIEIK